VSGEAGLRVKMTVKIVLCTLLAVVAVACVFATLTSLGVLNARADGQDEYLLMEYGDCIGIYCLPNTDTPAAVTKIRVATLPAADQKELIKGIVASDWDELVARLEDLGS